MSAKRRFSYVVVGGPRGSRRILGTFSDSSRASEFADAHNRINGNKLARVEKHEHDPSPSDVRRYHYVQIDESGDTVYEGTFVATPSRAHSLSPVRENAIIIKTASDGGKEYCGRGTLFFGASEDGFESAKSIALEHMQGHPSMVRGSDGGGGGIGDGC